MQSGMLERPECAVFKVLLVAPAVRVAFRGMKSARVGLSVVAVGQDRFVGLALNPCGSQAVLGRRFGRRASGVAKDRRELGGRDPARVEIGSRENCGVRWRFFARVVPVWRAIGVVVGLVGRASDDPRSCCDPRGVRTAIVETEDGVSVHINMALPPRGEHELGRIRHASGEAIRVLPGGERRGRSPEEQVGIVRISLVGAPDRRELSPERRDFFGQGIDRRLIGLAPDQFVVPCVRLKRLPQRSPGNATNEQKADRCNGVGHSFS